MKCPVCKTSDLLMTERQGIEIDYCASCRGVWLDRGELDKLLTRAADEPAAAAGLRGHGAEEHRYRDHRDERDHRDPRADWRHGEHARGDYPHRREPYKKKKSLLGELFDFD